MNYEVLLFDADDTLFDFKKTEEYALEKLVNSFETSYSKEYCIEKYKEINKQIWIEFEQGLITSDLLKVERFERFAKEINLDLDANKLSQMYIDYLGEGSFLYEESVDLISYLYKKYRLCIITNGLADVQNRRIKNSIIGKYFEDIVISDEIKIAKPNPEIFNHALKNINHENKDTVLMIGDSLSSDIKGGNNAGIHTCWFNAGKKHNSTDIMPTYEINSLSQIKELL